MYVLIISKPRINFLILNKQIKISKSNNKFSLKRICERNKKNYSKDQKLFLNNYCPNFLIKNRNSLK